MKNIPINDLIFGCICIYLIEIFYNFFLGCYIFIGKCISNMFDVTFYVFLSYFYLKKYINNTHKIMNNEINDDEIESIFQKEYGECIENELYTPSLLTKFSKHLYKKHFDVQKLISLSNQTKIIKQIFSSFLKIDENSEILKIYWEEFKLVKHIFTNKYFNGLKNINNYFVNTLTFVKNRLYIEPYFDKILAKSNFCLAFDKFCMNPNPSLKNKLICKICFDNQVSRTIIHDNHCCAIVCDECLKNISNTCPFCKCKIIEKKTLII